LSTFASYKADVIVEVCHPVITAEWGERFLEQADFYSGSPTAFADAEVEKRLRAAAAGNGHGHGLYIPAGAMWGGQDLGKMADRGSIKSLVITMKKHPLSLKMDGELGVKVAQLLSDGTQGESMVFEGSVRDLCPMAPSNVNTMAVAAIATHSLGFDGVTGRLIADPSLLAHVITIDAQGAVGSDGQQFRVYTERYNPAPPGATTGSATFGAFLSSLHLAQGRGAGLHLC
jgi:predicted dinucleotide-utilizing enzyme